jgi:formamidopyrimidine-DNA glycosylase
VPELPEVETYASDLAGVLVGRKLLGASADWPRQLPLNTPDELSRRVAGQTVVSVSRRGKLLAIRLSTDWLFVHLKMSGRLQVCPASTQPDPWAHVVFQLRGGDELRFVNPRKFGRVYLTHDPDVVVGDLGPEPLSDAFTVDAFRARLRSRRGRLKPLLLDQRFVAGLGNIYTDESLWGASLHPERPANTLTEDDARRLHASIRGVLTRAIEARGTSLSDAGYRDLTGNMGEMQGSLAVYGRAGLPCHRCDTTIERIVVSGRGTHLCTACQKPPIQATHPAGAARAG